MTDTTKQIDPRPWYLLSPALFAITLMIVVPMCFILIYSFYENIDLAVDRVAFQFGNWQELFSDNYYHYAIWKTLYMAVIVTVIAAVLGYIPAYYIVHTRFKHKWLLLLLLILPFWVSFIIRTFSWIPVLGGEGIINVVLQWLGVIDQPLDLLYNEGAVIMGMIHFLLPYMVLNIYVSLEGIDRNLVPAARTLGATPLQSFFEVTLPLSVPGLAAGCLLCFVLAAGTYVTPLILGGPGDFLFANLIYDALLDELNWPMGATLSFVLLIMLGTVVVVYNRFMGVAQVYKALS
jgi:spermidine/putrescine transport system permease protein